MIGSHCCREAAVDTLGRGDDGKAAGKCMKVIRCLGKTIRDRLVS